MTANDVQVAGDHYKGGDYQHWDWVEKNGLGYLEGYASKYVFRWRSKNGVEDLKKARHCIVKLWELHKAHGRKNRRQYPDRKDTVFFAKKNNLGILEEIFFTELAVWHNEEDLEGLIRIVDELIASA